MCGRSRAMILRRITQAFRRQDWFTVFVETMIVVLGVFLGLQVNNWNEDRADRVRASAYLERIRGDLHTDVVTYGDRVAFWSDVSGYGATALTYADTGETRGASQWELLLAFFQASQLGEFFTRDTTYEELKSAGELHLISNVALRDELANYYTTADNPALSERPLYREHIRGLIPFDIQLYIWENCYRTVLNEKQEMLACDSPINEGRTTEILEELRASKKLIEELRFWMSTMHVAGIMGRDRTRSATRILDLIDAQPGRGVKVQQIKEAPKP